MLDRLERQIPTNEETLHLFTKRDAVLKKNTDILMDIDKEGVTFNAIDTGRMEYLKGCRFPKVLHLKEGSRVMLLENMPNLGLVNGERGKVITFIGKYPLVEFEEGEKVLIKERTFHQVRIWCKVFEGYKAKRAYTAVLEKKNGKSTPNLSRFHTRYGFCALNTGLFSYFVQSPEKPHCMQSLDLSLVWGGTIKRKRKVPKN